MPLKCAAAQGYQLPCVCNISAFGRQQLSIPRGPAPTSRNISAFPGIPRLHRRNEECQRTAGLLFRRSATTRTSQPRASIRAFAAPPSTRACRFGRRHHPPRHGAHRTGAKSKTLRADAAAVHDELIFEVPERGSEDSAGREEVMEDAPMPAVALSAARGRRPRRARWDGHTNARLISNSCASFLRNFRSRLRCHSRLIACRRVGIAPCAAAPKPVPREARQVPACRASASRHRRPAHKSGGSSCANREHRRMRAWLTSVAAPRSPRSRIAPSRASFNDLDRRTGRRRAVFTNLSALQENLQVRHINEEFVILTTCSKPP